MAMNVQIIGMKGDLEFDEVVRHFTDLGGDVILLDPEMVCGKDHIISAVMHAEKAFTNGTNRSKTLLTETILYAAGDRQIGRATEKMRPKKGTKEMVAVLFNINDPQLQKIGMIRCDSIMEASPAKLKNLGADMFEGISCEDAAVEHVAMADLLKQ
jgi:KEOPS complex subunit Cgi121